MSAADDPRWLRLLSRPVIFTWAGCWLMSLLVVGTVAQRDLGLWLAQQIYFSSWLVWCFDVLPLPGGRLSMAVVFISILAFLFRPQPWRKPGIAIIHLGVLLLLAGGFVSAYMRLEGHVVLQQGQTAQALVSYDQSELAVISPVDGATDKVVAFTGSQLRAGSVLTHAQTPVQMRIERWYEHCQAVPLQTAPPADASGMAQRFQLQEAPPPLEATQRIRGAELRITAPAAIAGYYILFEGQSVEQRLQLEGVEHAIGIRRARLPLPFGLKLVEFRKENHPGTDVARSYESEVMLREQGQARRVLIEMNQPLRHAGFTCYQASFQPDGRGGYDSVLAVVRDYGYFFPYLSSLVMSIGLFIHLLAVVPPAFRRREGEA